LRAQVQDIRISLPDKVIPAVNTDKRYVVLYGGRGSSKSWSVADIFLLRGLEFPRRMLCTREIQSTIKDSVHKLLADTIERRGLGWFYNVQRDAIIGKNGSLFIFKGLRHNVTEVKSTEGIDLCWVEEAQSVSQDSWDILKPTIRKSDSQIYITYNPENEEDPTDIEFRQKEREDALVINMNYWDNPFFPEVLRSEMEYDRRTDYDKYLWVWEGQYRKVSEAQVFKGKYRVDEFEAPKGAEFYYGADWGFSQDPTALIRCYVENTKLYIDYEAYGVGVDIDETPQMFDSVPGARDNIITADSARPETISYMQKNGYSRMRSAKKGKNSVTDGVALIRSFEEIVIHPRCRHTIEEFKLYSHKKDRITGEILPVLIDKHNHCIDALRYALESVNKILKASNVSLGALGL
jgi:phage terminase large subunit